MKIGIFGGTFNPVHNGHVNLAKSYLKKLNLDKLIVIPSNIPPHKDVHDLTDRVDRYNLCRIAFSGPENIEVSDIEIRQEGKIRTVDTLRKLKEIYKNSEFHLIIGGDLLKSFYTWKDYKTLLEEAVLCVGARTEKEKHSLLKEKADLEKENSNIVFLDIPVLEISSTEIREKFINNQNTSRYLDDGVLTYIKTAGLYGQKNLEMDKYLQVMENMIVTEKRKLHSLNVAKEALTLAIKNSANPRKVYIAGLLHDVFKEKKLDEVLKYPNYSDIISGNDIYDFKALWHGHFAAKYVKDNFVELSDDIINSIKYHTTSRPDNSLVEKIIFVADLLEFGRNYSEASYIRDLTEKNFIDGYKYAVVRKVSFLIDKKKAVSPMAIYAYNDVILNL